MFHIRHLQKIRSEIFDCQSQSIRSKTCSSELKQKYSDDGRTKTKTETETKSTIITITITITTSSNRLEKEEEDFKAWQGKQKNQFERAFLLFTISRRGIFIF